MMRTRIAFVALTAALVASGACRHKPPVVTPAPASSPTPQAFPGNAPPTPAPPAPTTVPPEPTPVPVETRIAADPLPKSLDDLNRSAPLPPVYFAYDSDELDGTARQVLDQNAETLRKNPSWVVSVEGHTDERGTAEYNLALGERRALSAKTYLVSLGIAADRLRTVSYGKEFPFDTGHDEAAWWKNRRAHFMVTAAK